MENLYEPKMTFPSNSTVKGHDFNESPLSQLNLSEIFRRTGFQATALADAAHEIDRMVG